MIELPNNKGFVKNNPAVDIDINCIEKEMGVIFPEAYKRILRTTNGLSTGKGIGIYGLDEIMERNQTWEVEEYAKGYIAIGDNSGGTVFLMKQEINAEAIIAVDCGYMNPDDGAVIITSDLIKWVSEGCIIKDKGSSVSYTEPYDVILVSAPPNGSKDLLVLKKAFDLEMSIGELLRGSKQLPFVIMRDITYGKAIKRAERLGELVEIIKLVPSSGK